MSRFVIKVTQEYEDGMMGESYITFSDGLVFVSGRISEAKTYESIRDASKDIEKVKKHIGIRHGLSYDILCV